jgi:hypothetical protein
VQTFKETQMKLRTFKTIAFASALAITGAALPASGGQVLRVKVPFPFVLGGQEFSAGQYRVDQSDNGLIIVQGEGRAVAVLSTPGDFARRPDTSSIHFARSDSREYLVGVQVEGEGVRTIQRSGSQERRLTVASR